MGEEVCPRCLGFGRNSEDDLYDRDCSCQLMARIVELEEALRFYAEDSNYFESADDDAPGELIHKGTIEEAVIFDKGWKAKKALGLV